VYVGGWQEDEIGDRKDINWEDYPAAMVSGCCCVHC